MRYGMSFPVSSWQAVVAIAALETPRTLRNSRRLTPGFCVSWLMSVVAVRAVVARFLALARRRGWCGIRRPLLLGRIAGGLESFLWAVAVHVTADAPTHVEARVLKDAIHLLDLTVARLAGDAGVHVARVREVHVFRHFVNPYPRNGPGFRSHARTHPRDVREVIKFF